MHTCTCSGAGRPRRWSLGLRCCTAVRCRGGAGAARRCGAARCAGGGVSIRGVMITGPPYTPRTLDPPAAACARLPAACATYAHISPWPPGPAMAPRRRPRARGRDLDLRILQLMKFKIFSLKNMRARACGPRAVRRGMPAPRVRRAQQAQCAAHACALHVHVRHAHAHLQNHVGGRVDIVEYVRRAHRAAHGVRRTRTYSMAAARPISRTSTQHTIKRQAQCAARIPRGPHCSGTSAR